MASEESPPGSDSSAVEDVPDVPEVLAHFYRGEMDRVVNWRGRLDQTTNWAVTVMAAILTWVFSSPDNPHYVLLIAIGAVGTFHVIETRRYRMYDVWRSRVRLVEQDVIAPAVTGSVAPEHENWREELARDLQRPALKTPLLEALGRRLRRVYLPLLAVLLAAWVLRITAFASGENPLTAASAVGVPGVVVVGVVALCYVVWTALAFWPRDRQAMGELYDRDEEGEWKAD